MRAANYSSMSIFNLDQIKEINDIIKLNFIRGNDDYAKDAVKTSNVKFVNYGKIKEKIFPFVEFCLTANNNFFGFDLHPLTTMKKLNYNTYEGGDLVLFRSNEIICNEFSKPGSAIIFPAFTNHKVNKIISGKRHTLAIWMSGPKFR